MARRFIADSSQRLSATSAPVIAEPFTVSLWFYAADEWDFCALWGLGSFTNFNHFFRVQWQAEGDGYHANIALNDGGTEASVDTSNIQPFYTWKNYCGVFASDTSRTIILDGDIANAGTNATSKTVTTSIDRHAIGCFPNGGGFYNHSSGNIAEVGIWNVALTDAEIKLLAMGLSPLLVRRGNLIFYAPLTYRSRDFDIVGRLNMTATNSPSWAEHPSGLTYPEPMPAMIGEQTPLFWTLPVTEEEQPTTIFPFSDNFTGSNDDPWDLTKWVTSVA